MVTVIVECPSNCWTVTISTPRPTSWDANGRPVTIDSVTVTYDALGRAVEMDAGGYYSQIVYTPTGDKLALMTGQTLLRAFVPLPGGATAVYTSSGLDHYRHSDWLGSARLGTTPGQTVYSDVAYAPYGETYAQSGQKDFSFTGMNEDVEQNANPATLYDFPAREYGIQGRWPSPDPLGLGAVSLDDPQSWNRYAYVENSPLAFTDPSGEFGEGAILCAHPATCAIFVIGQILELFGLFGHHPTPHAPTAPADGYGAGIDPYGTWDESIPGGVQVFPTFGFPSASGCTYGSGSCGGWAMGWTKDTAGNVIGDFPGEELCTLGPLGSCLYWNLSARKWLPQDNASKLGEAINKTGVQSLANPCTVVAFYGSSAVAGAIGGYVAGGEASGAAASAYAASSPYWFFAASTAYKQAASGFTTVLRWGTAAYNGGKKACGAME